MRYLRISVNAKYRFICANNFISALFFFHLHLLLGFVVTDTINWEMLIRCFFKHWWWVVEARQLCQGCMSYLTALNKISQKQWLGYLNEETCHTNTASVGLNKWNKLMDLFIETKYQHIFFKFSSTVKLQYQRSNSPSRKRKKWLLKSETYYVSFCKDNTKSMQKVGK